MSNRYVGGVVTETTNVAQSPWSGSWTEQAAMQGFGSVLRIPNSLRFRASASAYLSRTPASAGNGQIFTVAFWVKRGTLSASGQNTVFITQSVGGTATEFLFNQDNLRVYYYNGGYVYHKITTQVFRDPSAWYHIVWSVDTTQATAANRVRLYVNGVQITSFSTSLDPAQNTTTDWNSAKTVYCSISSGTTMFDGYLADIYNIDGQALDPTAFGYINKETGVWAPIAYTGTYGLNGFRLPFTNGTSTTTLGYDFSGNGNNWTTNNISLTAGSTYDWMIDSPSKIQGTSYGVGNYAVLNPLAPSYNGNPTFSNANLTIAPNVTNYQSAWSTLNVTSGKWYGEFLVTGAPNSANWIGISSLSEIAYTAVNSGGFVGVSSTGYAYYIANGNKYTNSTSTSYGSAIVSGDIVSIALDLDNGKIWFAKNGTWQASGDPVAGTNAAFTGIVGSNGFSFGATVYNGGVSSFSANFGQRPFAYTPPTGYKTLCTQNLPVVTVYNGASYMAATLYTGNGATQSIVNAVNGVSFQPDLVWTKARSAAIAGLMYDSVRGATKYIQTNSTGAEGTGADSLTAFNVNGFSAGADTSTTGVNQNGTTYVGWQWKAGGTAVTNTAGSITSSVSANTTAGFSVVTYTGIATPGTVGHGLGANLGLLIVKCRNNASSWAVWHTALSGNQYLLLESTAAVGTASTVWNGATPTSSVFSVGSGSVPNTAGYTYVAYCFAAIAGYSAFGSYTGNGSSSGPFVYTGFLPRFILIKSTSASRDWIIWDTARNPYNIGTAGVLFPDTSSAEYSGGGAYAVSVVSNGFYLPVSTANLNGSGETMIYAAFAENPFSVALAR